MKYDPDRGTRMLGEALERRRALELENGPFSRDFIKSDFANILVPRNQKDEIARAMIQIKTSLFERYLQDPSMQQTLCDFFNSDEFEYLKKKWRDHSDSNPYRAFQDVDDDAQVKVIKELENAEEMRSPNSTEKFLKSMAVCMNDDPDYYFFQKGKVRIFTARAAKAFIEEIGEDSERIGRAWRVFVALAANNGYRQVLKPSTILESRLKSLKQKFPNFAMVVDHVIRQMRIWPLKLEQERRLKPILLNGPKGTGKSAFAQALAEALKTRYCYVNVASMSMGGVLTGTSNKWGNGQPGLIFSELARGETAFPLILLDEIDKSATDRQYPIEDSLLGLLEPQTARTLRDEFGGLEFDASRIIYVATSNNAEHISSPLASRFDVFNIAYPNRGQREVIIQSMLTKTYRHTRLSSSALSLLARQDGDLRALQTLLDKVVGCHVDAVLARMANGCRSSLRGAQLIEEHTVRIALEQTGIKAGRFDHIEV